MNDTDNASSEDQAENTHTAASAGVVSVREVRESIEVGEVDEPPDDIDED